MTACQSESLITGWMFFPSSWSRDCVGNHSLKTPSFFPNCLRITEGERRKPPPKRSSTAVMTPRIESALISRPRLETRLMFCPLRSVWLIQNDCEMVEKGTVCFEGECVSGSGWWGLCIPPVPPGWHCTASHTPEIKVGPTGPLSVCVSPIADGLGECGVQWCYEVTAPFLGAQEFGRADEASASDFHPQSGWVRVLRHPRCTGLWWISKPLLDHRREAAYRSHPGSPAFI